MNTEKELLRQKIIEFQQTIAELNIALTQKEELFYKKERDSFLGLLDIMDALGALEKNLETKKDKLDKTAKMLGKNIHSIHRKLLRYFKSASIVPMEFPGNKATMEYCKVIETRGHPGLENETIIEVVKNGFLNQQDNQVLRKAEVITVLNE
ncbi:MAG: nucleotide exchange factor GrpE [Desulfobacteraceae bacterium 4572_89]|nr:MAG: nucleotide exchange factor GrpE [Desulfobacteraceae bacterium 4572_89]